MSTDWSNYWAQCENAILGPDMTNAIVINPDFPSYRFFDPEKLAAMFPETDPGFITGDWSVEYPPIAEQSYRPVDVTGLKPPGMKVIHCGIGGLVFEPFPAAAMRDSAF